MKSVMTPQEIFSRVSKPNIQRSTFDRSHGYKTTFDAGKLIPVFCDEALPGDTFKLKASCFGRLATPLKPIMDNIALDIHFWSVPYRLVWDNFTKFMGEQDNPSDTTDYILPTMTAPVGGYGEGTNFDYLGIPTKVASIEHQSLPLRAMNLIWNQFYRDENLQDSKVVDKGDGPDDYSDYSTLLPRGKRKDYFTSALPFLQKGDAVTIPLGTTAPIINDPSVNKINLRNAGTDRGSMAWSSTFAVWANMTSGGFSQGDNLYLDSPSGIVADLTNASAQTINTLREAFSLQQFLEKDARGGTRYQEMNYSHFGVLGLDSRLQRPEYLGGGTSYVNVNPIAQQSATGSGTPQGNLAAMGVVSMYDKGFLKTFTEHEFVIGFVSARADLNYQQGLNKMWSRSTRIDHFFPAFQTQGEQAILNKEIYMDGSANDDLAFGFQERFAEYKYKPSMVTGLFRSNATASLDVWHLAQDFDSLPLLNDSFVQENPPIDRVIAVPSEPHFILDIMFDFKATRPMPVFNIPGGLSGRF